MYNSLLRDRVAPMLRSNGWKGSGKDYRRASELYRAGINFQKSRWNSKDEVEFTVNLWVLSDEAMAERSVATIEARHRWGSDIVVIPTWGGWSIRIGWLLPPKTDYWWRLNTGTSPERTQSEVLEALSDYALPAIDRQMEKPRVEPAAIIERPGQLTGHQYLPNGDIRHHNVGGQRLYPTDALLDVVHREVDLPERRNPLEVQVDLSTTDSDGWVSLETDDMRRQVAAAGVELSELMPIILVQWWVNPEGKRYRSPTTGEVRHNPTLGWGAEVSPKSRQELLAAIARANGEAVKP
jgi:hypothetical protein